MTPSSFLSMMQRPEEEDDDMEGAEEELTEVVAPSVSLNKAALGSLFKQSGEDNCGNCTNYDPEGIQCRLFDVEYQGSPEGSWCPWHEASTVSTDGDLSTPDSATGGASLSEGFGDSITPQPIRDIE